MIPPRLFALLAAGILAAPPAWSKPPTTAPSPPRLVVLLVVDQFGVDMFHRYRPHYRAGFARLWAAGRFYDDARFLHANTSTAPGHATLMTGAYPDTSGIVENTFFDRALGQRVSIFSDPAHSTLDAHASGPTDDTSPKNLLAETLADRLRVAHGPKAKVVALSYKNRAAILMAGRAGQAYWWSHQTGAFTSSTYYMRALPAWMARFNDPPPAARLFGATWEPTVPPDRSLAPTEDAATWEDDLYGLGRAFPHPLDGALTAPGPAFYRAIFATPFGSRILLDAARAAVEGESLGQDATPDLLGVSLSAFDYTGHLFGPHSREVEESLVALDRDLGAFFDFLDKKVGQARWLLALTGDHGSGPVPEYVRALGLSAGRIPTAVVRRAAEDGISERFGAGPWVVAVESPTLYLDRARLLARKVDPEAAERAACDGLLSLPGMQACFTRSALQRPAERPSSLEAAVRRSWHPARSGDVYPVARPYWLWGEFADRDLSTTHDSGWPYDARVPLFLAGPGVTPGTCRAPASQEMLAATLAAALGMAPPAQASPARLPCLDEP